MALACGVRMRLTAVLNSLIMAGVISWTSTPRTVDRAFCRLPRWSMAMAAMTPRSLASAFMRFILPADNTTGVIMARAEPEGGPFRGVRCLAEPGPRRTGERIPRGKPWYSHRISGKQRPESGGCPGFATHFRLERRFPETGFVIM